MRRRSAPNLGCGPSTRYFFETSRNGFGKSPVTATNAFAACRVAATRNKPATAPLAAAHAKASNHCVSGDSGESGGCVPVVVFHNESKNFCAATPPAAAATPPKIFQITKAYLRHEPNIAHSVRIYSSCYSSVTNGRVTSTVAFET